MDSLSQHGINMADIERVKSAGINTIKGWDNLRNGQEIRGPDFHPKPGLRMCTSKRLAAIKGISDAKVEKMKEAARKLDGHEFVTGFEYAEQRKESSKLFCSINGHSEDMTGFLI